MTGRREIVEITEYRHCLETEKYLAQMECYEWKAAKYLAALLKENRMEEALGEWWKLFLLVNGDDLVSFVTLSARDCISSPDPEFTPWLGFFHTAPESRGNRYGKILLDHACKVAGDGGYKNVYIATDHVGLYEKYGFAYLENRIDVWGIDSRIYKKELRSFGGN